MPKAQASSGAVASDAADLLFGFDERADAESEEPRSSDRKSGIEAPKARFVIDRDALPPIKSSIDPSKRTAGYHEPRNDDEWDPRWRPRKKIPGLRGWKDYQPICDAICPPHHLPEALIAALPRNEKGRVIPSLESHQAMLEHISNGGMPFVFYNDTGMARKTYEDWLKRNLARKAELDEVKRTYGADAQIEEGLYIAETPWVMEEVFVSYDGEGNVKRADVKRADAAYARKLLVTSKIDLAKRWAPERYGDKIAVATDDSLAARIRAAQKRTRQEYLEASREDVEDIESK